MKDKKILLVDILFPTKYSQWRICETTSFIQKKADIIVFKVDSFAGINFGADFEEMSHQQGFEDYNVIIFDPKYNHLNKYNKKIDGTKWNGCFNASYIVTTEETFDLSKYDYVYHIFLMSYIRFNTCATFPPQKQAIHLYPGGGFTSVESAKQIHPATKVISTNIITTKVLESLGHSNFIECLGGTFFTHSDVQWTPKRSKKEITVAFASMGHAAEKGADIYKLIAKTYRENFADDNVKFCAIGNITPDDNITTHPIMPMSELNKFYYENVDIMISLDTGLAFNGWPLGIEAVLGGAVLMTTDPHSLNSAMAIPTDALYIFDIKNTYDAVNFIRTMYLDREKLLHHAQAGWNYFSHVNSYNSQQQKIFDFIEA